MPLLASNFTSNSLQGTVIVNNGWANVLLNVDAFAFEGDKTFTIKLRREGFNGAVIATTSNITIKDFTEIVSLNANVATVYEGNLVGFTLTTVNVINYTNVFYSVLPVAGNITSADFVANSGMVTIVNNVGTFAIKTKTNSIPFPFNEIDESFKVQIRPNSPTGNTVFTSSSNTIIIDAPVITATGGNEITISGGYKIHTFLSSNNFVVENAPNTGNTVEVLMVAGGGGGGYGGPAGRHGGGGGAGGYITQPINVIANTYAVSIGAGGTGPAGPATFNGISGNPTTAFGLTAIGGGFGAGGKSGSNLSGGPGGSGGGGQNNPGGNGTPGQGFPGGSGGNSCGGGGAGGGGGPTGNGGGGANSTISGTLTYYAGGGGGAGPVSGGTGGQGGGGAGANTTITAVNGIAGTVNTGGGGGGGNTPVPISANPSGNGGAGGSGIVIIRYPYPD